MIRNVPAIISVLVIVDFLLAVAYVANFIAGQPIGVLNALLNLDGESSLTTWYSSVQLFAVSFSFGLLAITENSCTGSRIFIALTLIFLGLSVDEIVQIHEYLGAKIDFFLPGGDRNNTAFSKTGIWMFAVGIPVVGVIISLFWCAWSHLHMASAAFFKCLAGLFIFVAGAVGMETLSNFISGTAYVAEIATEELLEMIGTTIMLWGSLELLKVHGICLENREQFYGKLWT